MSCVCVCALPLDTFLRIIITIAFLDRQNIAEIRSFDELHKYLVILIQNIL